MQISDRVHLLASGSLGCSMSHPNDCNVYAVRCGKQYCIVDAGVGQNTGFILDELRTDGISRSQIFCILLTHCHLDHAGGAAQLQHNLQAPIFASSVAANALERGDEEAISLAPAKRAGIYGETFRLQSCPIGRRLEDLATFRASDCQVTALATPGHSNDMLSFLVETPEARLLFPGDTVFHSGRILLSPTWDCHPALYASTLRRLAELAIDGLFPGHGIWSVRDGARHLKCTLRYLEQLLLPPNILTGES